MWTRRLLVLAVALFGLTLFIQLLSVGEPPQQQLAASVASPVEQRPGGGASHQQQHEDEENEELAEDRSGEVQLAEDQAAAQQPAGYTEPEDNEAEPELAEDRAANQRMLPEDQAAEDGAPGPEAESRQDEQREQREQQEQQEQPNTSSSVALPAWYGTRGALPTPFGSLPPEADELNEYVRRRMAWDRDTRAEDPMKARGVVVYQCNGLCGGLGDRLYGMITCFYVAALTDRLFMVNSQYPVPFEMFVVPKEGGLDWRIDANLRQRWLDAPGGQRESSLSFIDSYPKSVVESSDWGQTLAGHVVNCRGNLVLANPMFRNAGLKQRWASELVTRVTPHTFARAAIRQLFQPSPRLQAELDKFWQRYPRSEYVTLGIQIRSGDRTKWFDPKRLDASSIQCFVDMAIELLPPVARQQGKKPLVFVATDSDEFAGKLRAELRARDASLVVVTEDTYVRSHLDRPTGQTTFAAYARTFVDYFLLAAMDMRLLSRSNFAYAASLIAPTGLGDLFYKDEDPTTPCKFIPFSIDPIANQ